MNTSKTKPTPANIRRRLARIEEHAAQACELAKRWNPKGRHFRVRREILQIVPKMEEAARILRESMTRNRAAFYAPSSR